VRLPSGSEIAVGPGSGGASAEIALKNSSLLYKTLMRGQLGFAEGYIDGDFETDDLMAVFDYFVDNEAAFLASVPSVVRSRWLDRLLHRRRANTRSGSRRNIAAHYDLGNEFYRLWLDADLNYSSGIYASACATLEEAQAEKHRRVLSALDLAADHDLLEIGCGWGGFVEAAARVCRRVTGITISRRQLEVARARMRRTGLASRASIRFEDYRDTTGSFDRIASIEMIEAVGEENWRTYFQTLSERLKPGGKAVIQAITIRDDLFEGYRRNPDFIQRYIFPGGMLPTVAAMAKHADAAQLAFEPIETFGVSYARTIADWRQRFDAAWPRICALGFDERFRRMWTYYLAYCEVGFARARIDVGLYRLTKCAKLHGRFAPSSPGD
jgi:cyclopropane-fatty-acyl-phospholipid synthase